MKYNLFFLLGSILFGLQACVAVPYITEEWAERQLLNLEIGEDKFAVVSKLGPPHHSTTIPTRGNAIEIYGYELGNYTYSNTGLLLFKNEKLVGVPTDYHELLKMLRLMHVIDADTQFYRMHEFALQTNSNVANAL